LGYSLSLYLTAVIYARYLGADHLDDDIAQLLIMGTGYTSRITFRGTRGKNDSLCTSVDHYLGLSYCSFAWVAFAADEADYLYWSALFKAEGCFEGNLELCPSGTEFKVC